jgi:hypothetical protein
MAVMTRTELYELVWSEPIRLLAPKYGISDVGLKKVCKCHDIATPSRGYWAKKVAGKEVKQVPLSHPTSNEIIEWGPQTPTDELDDSAEQVDEFPYSGLQDDVLRRIGLESLPEARVSIRRSLQKPHPCVVAAQNYLRRYGLPNGPPHDNTINIRVSRPLRRRALLILDALLTALELRGFEVRSACWVRLYDADVYLYLREKSNRIETVTYYGATSYAFEPNGLLAFEVQHGRAKRTRWWDRPRKILEEQLNDIIVGITLNAAAERESEIELAAWKAEVAERKAHEAIAERLAFNESTHCTELLKLATSWSEAVTIRRFLAIAEEKYTTGTLQLDPDSDFPTWLRWAKSQASELDPFSKALKLGCEVERA